MKEPLVIQINRASGPYRKHRVVAHGSVLVLRANSDDGRYRADVNGYVIESPTLVCHSLQSHAREIQDHRGRGMGKGERQVINGIQRTTAPGVA